MRSEGSHSGGRVPASSATIRRAPPRTIHPAAASTGSESAGRDIRRLRCVRPWRDTDSDRSGSFVRRRDGRAWGGRGSHSGGSVRASSATIRRAAPRTIYPAATSTGLRIGGTRYPPFRFRPWRDPIRLGRSRSHFGAATGMRTGVTTEGRLTTAAASGRPSPLFARRRCGRSTGRRFRPDSASGGRGTRRLRCVRPRRDTARSGGVFRARPRRRA